MSPATQTAPNPTRPDDSGAPSIETVPSAMRAIQQERYGETDALEVASLATPMPAAGEVLVRVHTAAASVGDVHVMTGRPYLVRVIGFGLLRPKHRVPGMALSGTVVRVGDGVTDWTVGDRVHGELEGGAFAEYVAVPSSKLSRVPEALSLDDAGALPWAATTALQALRDAGRVQAGERVLVNGASGAVGTFAVQVARILGAHVTAVCSTRNLERVRALGADEVIDYTRDDFTASAQPFDVVVDFVGNRDLEDLRRCMTATGRYVAGAMRMTNDWTGPVTAMLRVALANRRGSPSMVGFIAEASPDDLATLAGWAAEGRLRPLIDRRYPLEQVPDALDYLAAGHSQGRVLIDVTNDPPACHA